MLRPEHMLRPERPKLAALALGALGVACVSMAGLSYSGRTSLLGNQVMLLSLFTRLRFPILASHP
jgi:hypothetical protein